MPAYDTISKAPAELKQGVTAAQSAELASPRRAADSTSEDLSATAYRAAHAEPIGQGITAYLVAHDLLAGYLAAHAEGVVS